MSLSYLDSLNPIQKEAVLHTEGPLLIFAGAGSGKTRVLTYRVAQLIEQGIDPYHIIAITFTNKAAKEMCERISKITELGEQVWVSTFHSACTRILRRELSSLGYMKGFSIYDSGDSLRLIKDCIKEHNLSETNYNPRYVAQVISSQKNELITPALYEKKVAGSFRESNIAEIYATYQKRLLESNALDFDDIIFQTVELLKNNEEIKKKYQNRFRYVLVDEYQDTNHAQYTLVNLFAGYANNLCVVGDDDQSIYGWRGADIKNILQFEKDYPGTKIIKLEQNYRSTKTILGAANEIINNNELRAEKKLWTENPFGEPIRLYNAFDSRDEGAFVARIIQQGIREGANYSNFAVLYRTNAQSRGVEDQLVGAGIPYRIFGGVRFYEHMEIKDILAYLKAINNPSDVVSYLRIINVPKRGIGTASIEKIQTFASENSIPFYEALYRADSIPELGKKSKAVLEFSRLMSVFSQFAEENSIYDLISEIIRVTNYMTTIMDGTEAGKEREENIKELLAVAKTFDKTSEDGSLGKFLEDVALVADVDNYEENANAVTLMTLHSAKGLEFDTVFITGFEENLFPSQRAITAENNSQLEEERRLCYVGFTRAKRVLYVIHAQMRQRFDMMMRNQPSRFLKEVPTQYYKYVTSYGKEKDFKPSESAKSVTQPAKRNTQQVSSTMPDITKPAPPRPTPKNKTLDYKIGDKVNSPKHGNGEVVAIQPAGADYEISVEFEKGRKKFMSSLANLIKL